MSIACICTVNFVFPATHFVSWLLCTAVLWTSMYKLPLRNSAFIYTQKWVQNQVIVLVSSFSGTFTLVSIEVRQFYNTTNRAHGFQFLHIPTQTCYFLSLKKVAILTNMRMITGTEYFFIHFFVICIYRWQNIFFKISVLSNWVF